jgi:hypothetical protein
MRVHVRACACACVLVSVCVLTVVQECPGSRYAHLFAARSKQVEGYVDNPHFYE